MKINTLFILCLSTTLWMSCQESGTKVFQPIVMGDTTTIVTETNPQFLKNDVDDIEPSKRIATSTAVTKVDTPKAAPVAKTTIPYKTIILPTLQATIL